MTGLAPRRSWWSGGQTGVDRALLDAAVAAGAAYGGWCPAGGWAEDFPEPPGLLARYPGLRATPAADPAQRTAWNVRDSAATVVLRLAATSPGTDLTVAEATRLGRPLLTLDDAPRSAAETTDAAARIADWLRTVAPAAGPVNVAGPRESERPGAYDASYPLLTLLIRQVSAS